jgi:hypothetical protein
MNDITKLRKNIYNSAWIGFGKRNFEYEYVPTRLKNKIPKILLEEYFDYLSDINKIEKNIKTQTDLWVKRQIQLIEAEKVLLKLLEHEETKQ